MRVRDRERFSGSRAAADPAEIAKKSNCSTSHAVDRKVVGPTSQDVAAKHKNDPDGCGQAGEKSQGRRLRCLGPGADAAEPTSFGCRYPGLGRLGFEPKIALTKAMPIVNRGMDGHPLAIVRGVGEIGSAIAHRLFSSGLPVIIHDHPAPAACRRGMAFVDAMFDGYSMLDDIGAQRTADDREIALLLQSRAAVPVSAGDFSQLVRAFRPHILIDARMRKRALPEPQMLFAPVTIGIGPNFVAGRSVDAVIESEWGEHLGRVIGERCARPLAGEPRRIGGLGRERFVYAPASGVFRSSRPIGARVRAGEMLAAIDGLPLLAPLSGTLRGLTRDGVPVTAGSKVIEVIPHGAVSPVFGLGERPLKIAAGVVEAIGTRVLACCLVLPAARVRA